MDSIEAFLKQEFNYTEELMSDFKEWAEKNKNEIELRKPLSKSSLYYMYVSHQVERAKRNGSSDI